MDLQSKIQGLRGGAADKRIATFVKDNYPEQKRLTKGDFNDPQTKINEFFKGGRAKSLSRVGIEPNNFVNYAIPTIQSAHAVSHIMEEFEKTTGALAFRKDKNGNIEFLGNDFEKIGQMKNPFTNNRSSGQCDDLGKEKAKEIGLSLEKIEAQIAKDTKHLDNNNGMSLPAWEKHISSQKYQDK